MGELDRRTIETLARVDQRVEDIHAWVKEFKEDSDERHKELEVRVRRLERWRNYLVGIFAATTTAVGGGIHKLFMGS
jgi:hypothetical protein